MRKIIKLLIMMDILAIIIVAIFNDIKNVQKKEIYTISSNGAIKNGWLSVKGAKLINENNKEIQLRGVSTHGIQWYRSMYNSENIKILKDDWGINVLRVALYTDPKQDGYIKKKYLKNEVYAIVDDAIKQDLYVIIDWHILDDGNPTKYEKEALEFFDELSNRYKDVPNVIFEICNEPNGDDVSWDIIKSYAEKVIKKIRANSKKSLIIVGTPDWCKDIYSVIKNPIKDNNVIYALHFYAGTDGLSLRNKISTFLNKDLPIFISECGITDNTGDGKIYEKSFNKWMKYINNKKLSWIFWSFSNKDETSSLIDTEYDAYDLPKFEPSKDPKNKEDSSINGHLTETGEIIKNIFKQYKK